MTKEDNMMTGAQALMECMLAEGVDTIFGYPGGSILPVYNAMYDYRDRIKHVLVRHEQAAVHAAQGYARASGKVGVVVVTSGPGATNTVSGLADAMMDSTPLVLISGQVGSGSLGTDAFQEVNFVGITQAVTKWNIQIKRPEDLPAAFAKAFYVARSGRPGPVVIDFSKDAQTNSAPFSYEKNREHSILSYCPYPNIDMAKIDEAAALINLAKRPIAMIGQGVTLAGAEKELLTFLERSGMPVASTLLGLSAVPSDHPQYVGMLGMHGNYGPNVKNKDYDLVVAIGMRFDDRVISNANTFACNAQVIHLDIDNAEISKLVYADVPVLGDAKETLPKITRRLQQRDHSEWIKEFHACDRIEMETVIYPSIKPRTKYLRMAEVASAVSEAYNHQAILVTDVGQHQMAAVRYFKYTTPRSVITSGGMGTMGFGVPAAIGAKIAMPEKDVILFVGDGGIQMNLQEMCTAMQENAHVRIVLLSNNYLGMVRQWQELFYDRRYSATPISNPDYEHIAAAYNFGFRRVERHEDLQDAIQEMKDYNGPFLLQACCEQEENIFPMVPAGASVTDVRLE